MKSQNKPKTKSNWMRQFVIISEKKDDLAISQFDARRQVKDSALKNKKHYITK